MPWHCLPGFFVREKTYLHVAGYTYVAAGADRQHLIPDVMKKWFPATVALLLLVLLAAPEVRAQNSFNYWTADPPAPITPLHKRPRSKPVPAKDTVVVAAEVPRVKQSKLIKRGLTQRMREHRPLEEDSISVVFFAQNSQYPNEAAKAGAQGNVVIRLEVAPNGSVSRTSVVSMDPRPLPGWNNTIPPSAMQALANEAQRVFRMLQFEPATRTSQEELSASFSLQ